jgi:hypothetical protein
VPLTLLSIYAQKIDIETVSQTKTIIESQETSNVEVDASWVLLKPFFNPKNILVSFVRFSVVVVKDDVAINSYNP